MTWDEYVYRVVDRAGKPVTDEIDLATAVVTRAELDLWEEVRGPHQIERAPQREWEVVG